MRFGFAAAEAAHVTKAKKIVAAAARGITPLSSVMASPPTISAGAANQASTINGAATAYQAQQIQPDNAKVTAIGGAWQLSTNQFTGAGQMGLNGVGMRGTQGNGFIFATDSPNIDLATQSKVALYVTDPETGLRQRAAADDQQATLGSMCYIKWAFGSARPRILEFRFDTTTVMRGWNIDAGYSWWKVDRRDEPRVAFLGDSYIAATISQTVASTKQVMQNFCQYFFAQLGVTGGLALGSAGTGFLNNANGHQFINRLNGGDLSIARHGELDLVIVPNSVNDDVGLNAAYTDAAVAAANTAFFTALRAAQPNAIIMSWGPEITVTRPSTQARFDALKAAFEGVKGADPSMIWLDNSPSGEAWLHNSAPNNNALYMGPDNTHPNDAGHAYLGRRAAHSALAALKALAA